MKRSLLPVPLLVILSASCAAPVAPTVSPIAPPTANRVQELKPVLATQPAPNPREIQAAVHQRSGEIRECYMLGTFRDSQLAGTVHVMFTIVSSGKVTETVDVGSDIPDAAVVECVLGVFAKLEFRAGQYYPTQVEYPIRFGKS
jgi:hypothetical protein